MRAGVRPLVLDATALSAPQAGPGRDLARALAAGSPGLAAIVTVGTRGLERVDAADFTARLDTGRPGSAPAGERAFAAVRASLIGGVRPLAAHATRKPTAEAGFWPSIVASLVPRRHGPDLPPHAALLKPGLVGWDEAHLQALLQRRPDLAPIGLVDAPVGLDWPEYETQAEVAALHRGLAALARSARAIVVPDERTRGRAAAVLEEVGRGATPIHVAPSPSRIAGTEVPRFDAELAAVPYLIAPGPIEASANCLLLLLLWRDMVRDGGAVPKLVLAGERGRQIEEIKPLLDWNETLRGHVIEAPGLSPQALGHVIAHARALLAPSFVDPCDALVRDALRRGTPVIAARTTGHPAREGVVERSPIDGRGWRAAIAAVAGRGVTAVATADLPDWPRYAERIARVATALA